MSRGTFLLVALAIGSQEEAPTPLRAAGDELRPGLAAVYRDDAGASISRIDPKPALTIRGARSLHPRLWPGPFEATWEGAFAQPESGPLRFGAYVRGTVKVTLGGVVTLEGGGDSDTSWIKSNTTWRWTPGLYRIRIEFRSHRAGPARFQLWWEGESFTREPVPPWRFRHLPADLRESFRQDERVERGRLAAERFGCARCHRWAFPSATPILPGPSLAEAGHRLDRGWLLRWLDDPQHVRPGARMPALFKDDRDGFVDRWILADFLLRPGDQMTVPEHTF